MITESLFEEHIEFGEYCHGKGIKFIAADTKGLFGYAFKIFNNHQKMGFRNTLKTFISQ